VPIHFTWDIGVEAGLPLLLQDRAASYIYGPGGMLLEQIQGSTPYYYPATQQFTSRDPLAGSLQPYAYASGNPINYTDPAGMQAGPNQQLPPSWTVNEQPNGTWV
jgi:hypothetical protein